MNTEEYVSKRVKDLCELYKISKYRLAQMTGITQTMIARIISQENLPTIPTLEKICDAFGITLAQFFDKEEVRLDLTKDKKELLKEWDQLGPKERKIIKTLIQALKEN